MGKYRSDGERDENNRTAASVPNTVGPWTGQLRAIHTTWSSYQLDSFLAPGREGGRPLHARTNWAAGRLLLPVEKLPVVQVPDSCLPTR